MGVEINGNFVINGGMVFGAYTEVTTSTTTTTTTVFSGTVATFSASGTWTKPEGVTTVVVECWGAGGAGGGSNVNGGGSGGGAGGQYAKSTLSYPSASQNISYTVAPITTPGTGDGPNGSDTIWGSNVVVAKGGQGGGAYSNGTGFGAAGIGTTASGVGDIVIAGSSGIEGFFNTPFAVAGGGGDAAGFGTLNAAADFAGAGGTGNQISSGGFDGSPGNNFGGGGGGAGKTSGASRPGGSGGAGIIRITYA